MIVHKVVCNELRFFSCLYSFLSWKRAFRKRYIFMYELYTWGEVYIIVWNSMNYGLMTLPITVKYTLLVLI